MLSAVEWKDTQPLRYMRHGSSGSGGFREGGLEGSDISPPPPPQHFLDPNVSRREPSRAFEIGSHINLGVWSSMTLLFTLFICLFRQSKTCSKYTNIYNILTHAKSK